MQIYLVGGAVRDQLLGLPVKERDWVVVGASPQEMLAQGFQQVGKDFPVFLHPETQEEYALARKERKMGHGYAGFACETHPAVTLKDDLLRRDLTINAMAMDAQGRLIDFYGGQADLKQKILRHVSDAFVEDPVRALRLARFKSQFHHLGFQVAPLTRQLVYQMAESGEFNYLVPERVWQEWEQSLHARHPEQFILTLRASGALRLIFPEIDALFGIPAAPTHHPEIDTGMHVMQVLQYAHQHAADPVVSFSALMHDLGKAATQKTLWPSHAGHDETGLPCIQACCERLRIPRAFREAALTSCRYHLQIARATRLTPEAIVSVLVGSGAFRDPRRFKRLLDLVEADAQGGSAWSRKRLFWEACLQACAAIQSEAFVQHAQDGQAIQDALLRARLQVIQHVLRGEQA